MSVSKHSTWNRAASLDCAYRGGPWCRPQHFHPARLPDETGFTADGEFMDGVFYYGGMTHTAGMVGNHAGQARFVPKWPAHLNPYGTRVLKSSNTFRHWAQTTEPGGNQAELGPALNGLGSLPCVEVGCGVSGIGGVDPDLWECHALEYCTVNIVTADLEEFIERCHNVGLEPFGIVDGVQGAQLAADVRDGCCPGFKEKGAGKPVWCA
jgi:hypothetical protein